MHTSELGDHIGMESCVDLETDTEPLQSCPSKAIARKPWGTTSSRKSSMCAKKMKNLPPPLPIQSSTVMKRYYTNDGRLVITEEKVESPKYHFNAIRADGRLTLQLVEPYEPKMVREGVVEVEEVNLVTMSDTEETDENIEIWKMKKRIKELESARGNGTSMVSLIIPPNDQISRVTKLLREEYGTASNIKSRVNRQSVQGAITSAQQRLKLYSKVPPNGLVLYTGTIVTDDGKERKVTEDFEPFKPIRTNVYLCDNRFHTEALNALLESGEKFGFIVMDGNGALFGTLSGNSKETLHKFTVDLPKKHGRGGQSALRFGRLRMEKRHNYVRKTAELATQFFVNPATSQPNVFGLILAGCADFKTELSQSDMFDKRLKEKILKVVDVSYGGEHGFNQAIELSCEYLDNVKFIQEKRLLGKYFEEMSNDTDKYVFSVDNTLKALEMGAVEVLILWENHDMNRYTLKNKTSGEIIVKHLNKEQESDKSNFRDRETNAELEVEEKISLLDWFVNEYKKFGCTLEFVTNKSELGSQFCRGIGGIGGILRYQWEAVASVRDQAIDPSLKSPNIARWTVQHVI
ncbi:eukaryotic peptide chain release factor subunit 1-3 [Artemisia annua]|uniref:Eukaryotic peptide chain release factor subunit 1-3 n=1 Tax=Artemisia annua TaxID=35608 RepID=A0A2U1N9Q7_ARTAN|nr:eukaryotic peptide chain release factor subunit 1-3 [Artemisia annua]